jgi:hypothetical protein
VLILVAIAQRPRAASIAAIIARLLAAAHPLPASAGMRTVRLEKQQVRRASVGAFQTGVGSQSAFCDVDCDVTRRERRSESPCYEVGRWKKKVRASQRKVLTSRGLCLKLETVIFSRRRAL